MKTVSLLSLPFVFSTAVVARADASVVPISNLTFTHRTNLIDTDQSQTFETLSVADEFTRLPVSAYKEAKVYFITSDKGQVFNKSGAAGSTFDDPSGKQCKGEGYDLTSCDGTASDYCPYNGNYFKTCCDDSYKYDKSDACVAPQTFSEKSCGGKYRCECRTEDYPVTICEAPKEAGEKCTDDKGTHYASCSCPTGVDVAKEDCKTFYNAPCSDVCKEAYGDTCHLYEGKGVSYDLFGCEKFFDGCDSICEKAYTDNCQNRDDMPHPHGCKTPWFDCTEKCQEAYPDGCHNYTDAAPYDKDTCKTPYDDCQAKCKEPYPDGCHKRTTVIDTCPKGAECTYYSDCSSKVESWECIKGLEKVGNACQFMLPVVYGDKSVTKEYLLPDKTPVGIVFDETNKLAVALTDVKKDGSAGHETMQWSSYASIASLWICGTTRLGIEKADIEQGNRVNSDAMLACGVDGHDNTIAILACDSCDGTPAATACSLYQPDDCTDNFCKLGKWFLPSMRELNNIYQIKELINSTLTALADKGAQVFSKISYWYWSSTQEGDFSTWILDMTDGRRYMSNKHDTLSVRPVVAYEEKGLPLPVLYGDGTVSKEYPVLAGKKAIGVVFDETNKLAVALTDVKKDGSEGSETMMWSSEIYNIPDLEACTSITNGQENDGTVESCGVDGRANTDAILACGDECGETPAATACNLYEPQDCTADFCKAGKWFLPSLRDLENIYLQRASIRLTQRPLGKGYLKEPRYWSSTTYFKNSAWVIDMLTNFRYHEAIDGSVYLVRPVIKYQDTTENSSSGSDSGNSETNTPNESGDMETQNCAVANCVKCEAGRTDSCETCTSGYTLTLRMRPTDPQTCYVNNGNPTLPDISGDSGTSGGNTGNTSGGGGSGSVPMWDSCEEFCRYQSLPGEMENYAGAINTPEGPTWCVCEQLIGGVPGHKGS